LGINPLVAVASALLSEMVRLQTKLMSAKSVRAERTDVTRKSSGFEPARCKDGAEAAQVWLRVCALHCLVRPLCHPPWV